MSLKKMIAALIAACTLTSCTASGRVHDKAYLRAVSICGENEKTLTLTFFSDEKSVVTVTGSSVENALTAAELRTGRRIFTGYTELVILGGTQEFSVLEDLLSVWKVSPSCMIAYGGSECGSILHDIPAEQLHGSVENAVKKGISPDCGIVTVLSGLLSKDHKAVIPEISADGAAGRTVPLCVCDLGGGKPF